MWDILPYITTPISLVALALVIIFASKRVKVNADIEKLNNLDSKDKAKILPILEEKYHYKTDSLTKNQIYDLAKSQLEDLAKKRRDQLLFSSFLAILFLIIFIISVLKIPSDNTKVINNIVQPSDSINTNSISTLSYNIVDSIQSISLIFSSKLLTRKDTIKVLLSQTVNNLMEDLIKNYELNQIIERGNYNADRIFWAFIHENKEVNKKELSKQMNSFAWKNFDRVALEYRIITKPKPGSGPPKKNP